MWDLTPVILCDKHLLGMHSEIHAIWNIITQTKRGYSRHPEVIRWQGRLKALKYYHDRVTSEMQIRKFKHNSPLNEDLALGSNTQEIFIDTVPEQLEILKKKGCGCKIP